MSFPLQSAKLCLEKDCETVFSSGGDKCIKCGGTQWVWLSKYIISLKENQNEKINPIHYDDSGNLSGITPVS